MFSLALLSNAFIVFYSCLDIETTQKWNRKFTSLFANIVNSISKKEVKTIPLNGIEIKLSNETAYEYNYVPGYQLNEIPLGSAKQIECSFSPVDATNKSITYSVEPVGSLLLNQNGSTLSAVGMKTGVCTLTATSNDGGYSSSVSINVIEPVAPSSFTPSLENSTIKLGTTETIKYDIDGGVLTHDELINFRYYDIKKLNYTYDDSIISIDKHGVIHPIHEGSTSIQISNGTLVKSLNVTIAGSESPVVYTDLKIFGDDICRENEMLVDQNTHTNNHIMIIKDGDTVLNNEDFIWTSSNELLAKIDMHGVLRGFRKSTFNDETITITATSKVTGQSASFDVIVKKQAPTKLNYVISIGKQSYWQPTEQIVSIGDDLKVELRFSPSGCDKNVLFSCDDSSVISFLNEGTFINCQIQKIGKCTLTVSSEANPNAGFSVSFIVVKPGAISSDAMEDVGFTIRKSLGHAAVFMITQIFTFLTFYMFLSNKKWWLHTSLSLGEGLLISIMSEVIQYFVPSRSGAVLDVLIDFGGVVVGALIAFLITLLIKKTTKKKSE